MRIGQQQALQHFGLAYLGTPVLFHRFIGIALALAEIVEHQLAAGLLGKTVGEKFLDFLLRHDHPLDAERQEQLGARLADVLLGLEIDDVVFALLGTVQAFPGLVQGLLVNEFGTMVGSSDSTSNWIPCSLTLLIR